MSDFSDPKFYWGQIPENPRQPLTEEEIKRMAKNHKSPKKDCIIKRIAKKFTRRKG